MNKVFELILEKMEEKLRKLEERYHRYLDDSNLSCMFDRSDIEEKRVDTIKEMIEIVQEVSEEFATDTNVGTNGWIACSERLPVIDGNTSDTVLVCGSNGFLHMAFWCDDLQWRFCECGMAKEPVLWTEIVAWQPLPESFKECD